MTPLDIRDIRLAYRISSQQLALILGVHPKTVYAWESTSSPNMPPPYARVILMRLAEATREPVPFFRTSHAIEAALKMPPAPETGTPMKRTKKGEFAKGVVIGFGLGLLLKALFSESDEEA